MVKWSSRLPAVPVFRVPRRGLQGYWRGAIVFRCYGLGFRVSRFGILGSGGGGVVGV